MAKPIPGKRPKKFKRDTRKRRFGERPRNETAYRGCKKKFNAFLKNPNKKTWAEFKKSHENLMKVNATMGIALMNLARKEMYNRVIFEKDLQ